jgi:DNA-binding SARP family transcriptional activator
MGRPTVLVNGVAVQPPRGAKAWGLLAYLVSTDRAHPRSELAELLFGEAADPLGALRWNLAALRRLLDRPDVLKGDLIRLDLPDAVIDVHELERDQDTSPEAGATGELLQGLSFPDSPRFELWLAGERARLLRTTTSRRRERVLRALAAGDHDLAVRGARDLAAIDPLDEGHQALLIRAHALAGDAPAARAQYERCRALLRRELAIEPGPAVVAAAHLAAGAAHAPARVDRSTIEARLTIAWQSFLAGSVDHGIDLGRGVVVMADRGDDTSLRIMARLFLSAMLSMAVRGWDESAATTTEALHLAEQAGLPYEAATAHGVLAGIDLMRADYPAAAGHARSGADLTDDAGARAINTTFLAAIEADIGQGEQAVRHALAAVDEAEQSADPIRIAYATAYAGHALLLEDDGPAARAHVERAVAVSAPMLVFQPWPLAMLAEVEVRAGDLDAASATATRAAAIAATTDVAYQRALALRAAALVSFARGDPDAATGQLTEALGQARRTTGEGYGFHWPIAWIHESLADTSTEPDDTRRWVAALLDHANATGMLTFTERAERALAPSVTNAVTLTGRADERVR